VIDAKYKAEKCKDYPNPDLYQILAYCTVLNLSQGHLVYAKGNEVPVQRAVRHAGTRIICHAIDLAQPPPSSSTRCAPWPTLSPAVLVRTGILRRNGQVGGDMEGCRRSRVRRCYPCTSQRVQIVFLITVMTNFVGGG
jgi:hypothetical protein